MEMEMDLLVWTEFIGISLIVTGVIFLCAVKGRIGIIINLAFIIIGTGMLISIFFKNRNTEAKINEILSKNESIVEITTNKKNLEFIKEIMKEYNYEFIYKTDDKVILVKPLEMRFIKKDLFEKEFKTTVDNETFWKKQLENNKEYKNQYYPNDKVIFKQFIQGQKNYFGYNIISNSLILIDFENFDFISREMFGLSQNFKVLQIVIENKKSLDLKDKIDISQFKKSFLEFGYKLVKEEIGDETYIYTFSIIVDKPNFLIEKEHSN